MTGKGKSCLDGKGNSNRIPHLVQTDYDNFKNMRFFIEQERKAQAMLKEVTDFKTSFIISKLVSFEDWYYENVNPDADFHEIHHEFQKIHGRWLGPPSSQKNCVIFNGKIKFVAQCTLDYSAEISKDEKNIIFSFSDEYNKPSRSSFGQMEREYGLCRLTYSIDNNELIKYERPWK